MPLVQTLALVPSKDRPDLLKEQVLLTTHMHVNATMVANTVGRDGLNISFGLNGYPYPPQMRPISYERRRDDEDDEWDDDYVDYAIDLMFTFPATFVLADVRKFIPRSFAGWVKLVAPSIYGIDNLDRVPIANAYVDYMDWCVANPELIQALPTVALNGNSPAFANCYPGNMDDKGDVCMGGVPAGDDHYQTYEQYISSGFNDDLSTRLSCELIIPITIEFTKDGFTVYGGLKYIIDTSKRLILSDPAITKRKRPTAQTVYDLVAYAAPYGVIEPDSTSFFGVLSSYSLCNFNYEIVDLFVKLYKEYIISNFENGATRLNTNLYGVLA